MKYLIFCFTLIIKITLFSQESEVRKGIDLLFENQTNSVNCIPEQTCIESIDRNELVQKALEFKSLYQNILSQYKLNDLVWKKKSNNSNVTEFQYSSPIQKPGSVANIVHGYIYRPPTPEGCHVKFPGTLLVHHVANDISNEQTFASMASQSYRGVVMVIYLPEYGPRKKDLNAPPFSSDIQSFKESILQSLVDIRIAGEILKNDDLVEKNKLQLGGLSLGALMSAISAGIDPFFDRYLIGLGGGDLANAMTIDSSKSVSVIKDALKNINWNVDFARKELSVFDALTWAYTVKNKQFVFLSAVNDELVNEEKSILKLIHAYKQNRNSIQHYRHRGSHVPDPKEIGFTDSLIAYAKVIYRVFDFLGPIKSAEVERCKGTNY